ncbi:MAG TPA: AIPR family protein [Herpetosiphonaceae bacterium]
MQASQTTHRQALIDTLTEDIRQEATEQSLPFATAATRILLDWLGYDLDQLTFIDGRDRGIDAWLSTDSGFDIFQIKTHQLTPDGFLDLRAFDGQGVRDLEHAKTFLLHERSQNVQNQKLKQLLHQWDSAIRNHNLTSTAVPLPVTLHLVILGDQLTSQANTEFKALQSATSQPITTGPEQILVQFHVVLHTIDQIIDGKWRERNRDWTDQRGRRYDRINLSLSIKEFISDNANAVFYCRAIDLVRAYETLGYQIFEPNVRANIKNSRVNQAIRDSVVHQRTRREFRFLNNGVTITCDSFTKPSPQKLYFTVAHPGIVNGLQTVVALHTAYHELSDEDKADFEEHCAVLVRILTSKAVADITRVVKSTNNQNPMKLRNLASNNTEQLIYARLFAEDLDWFYEAKEGAWDAFAKDPKRWRPALAKRPRDFQVTNGRKVRRVDNEDLAQAWLAFIGFALEAANEKKGLFDDRFYQLIFTQQTRQHGFDYDFAVARARSEVIEQSPQASLMLVAYLTRVFASEMVPSATQNRQDACNRLQIDPRMAKAELDVRLSQDNTFLLNQVLGGMSLLFTEFVGFVFYRSLGDQLHRYGPRILANHSFATLTSQYAIEAVRERIKTEDFHERDLLAILWLAFVDTIEDLMASGWGQSYQAAPVKSRFIFLRETRDRIYRQVQSTNDFMKKRSLKQAWTIGVAEGQGLFDFVKSCLSS